jgi:hypothetical protein
MQAKIQKGVKAVEFASSTATPLVDQEPHPTSFFPNFASINVLLSFESEFLTIGIEYGLNGV